METVDYHGALRCEDCLSRYGVFSGYGWIRTYWDGAADLPRGGEAMTHEDYNEIRALIRLELEPTDRRERRIALLAEMAVDLRAALCWDRNLAVEEAFAIVAEVEARVDAEGKEGQ